MKTSLPLPTHEASRVKWVQFWLLEETGLPELRQVAERLGITRSQLTNIIQGRRRSASLQAKIAAMAKRPALELFGPHTHWSLLSTHNKRRKAG